VDYQKVVDNISRWHSKRFPWQPESCKDTDVAYHYLVFSDWTVVQTRCINNIWFHNKKNNSTSIGVALVWNFNKEKPTQEAYEALNILLQVLRTQFPDAKIKPHRSWWSTCPGKYFDPLKAGIIVDKNKPTTIKKSNGITGYYEITRYYSPIKWQERYYKWKSYEADVTMNCWASNIWNSWCLFPAFWWILTNEEAGLMVACWEQFPSYTKFKIEWYWWVTCRDRWWAIKWKHLDLWMWIWMQWLEAIEKIKWPAWDYVLISEVLFPNNK